MEELEDYRPDDLAGSEYHRVRWRIATAGGNREAWIYLAGPPWDLAALPRVESGDWLTR